MYKKFLILLALALTVLGVAVSGAAVQAQDDIELDETYVWEDRVMSISFPSDWSLTESSIQSSEVVLRSPNSDITLTIAYADLYDVSLGYGDQLSDTGFAVLNDYFAATGAERFDMQMVLTNYGLVGYTEAGETGTYFVGFVVARNDDAFSIVLSSPNVNLNQSVVSAMMESVTIGEDVDLTVDRADGGSVAVGDTVTDAIDEAEIAYTLDATAGDNLTIEMVADNQDDLDTVLLLFADGIEVAISDDGFDQGFNSRIRDFTLPPADTYTIVASRYDDDDAGGFTLTVRDAAVAAAEDAEAAFEEPGELVEVTASSGRVVISLPSNWVHGEGLTDFASTQEALEAIRSGESMPTGTVAVQLLSPFDLEDDFGVSRDATAIDTAETILGLLEVDAEVTEYDLLDFPATVADVSETIIPRNVFLITMVTPNGPFAVAIQWDGDLSMYGPTLDEILNSVQYFPEFE